MDQTYHYSLHRVGLQQLDFTNVFPLASYVYDVVQRDHWQMLKYNMEHLN